MLYASKRETDLQDLPMSVSVLTATDLENAGLEDMSALLSTSPCSIDNMQSPSPRPPFVSEE
jgi:outer membrane receptor for ferrienterochelin and colicin